MPSCSSDSDCGSRYQPYCVDGKCSANPAHDFDTAMGVAGGSAGGAISDAAARLGAGRSLGGAVDADDTLNEGEEVQAVLYFKDTAYVDDDGYYISPVFRATTNLERVDNLEDGDMTIMYDKFEEDGTTWTVYYAYETTVTPTVAVTSDVSGFYATAEERALSDLYGATSGQTIGAYDDSGEKEK